MSLEETRVPGIFRDADGEGGGSLVTEFWASYKDLVHLFGEPNSPGDEYKVSTEWSLETEEGISFRIYDYKETSMYGGSDYPTVEQFRAQAGYDWHLGGPNDGYGNPIPKWAESVIQKITLAIKNMHKEPS